MSGKKFFFFVHKRVMRFEENSPSHSRSPCQISKTADIALIALLDLKLGIVYFVTCDQASFKSNLEILGGVTVSYVPCTSVKNSVFSVCFLFVCFYFFRYRRMFFRSSV